MEQAVFLIAMLMTALYGCWRIVRRPAILRLIPREGRLMWAGSAALYVAGALLFLVSYFSGESTDGRIAATLLAGMAAMGMLAIAIHPAAEEMEGDAPRRLTRSALPGVGWCLAVALGWSAIFFAIFLVTDVKPSAEGPLGQVSPSRLIEFMGVMMLVIVAGPFEEIIFRGGMQQLLWRRLRLPLPLSIVLVALLFALGHGNYLQEVGPKEAQIVGLGMIFGYTRWRYGTVAAALVHAAHNGAAVLVALATAGGD